MDTMKFLNPILSILIVVGSYSTFFYYLVVCDWQIEEGLAESIGTILGTVMIPLGFGVSFILHKLGIKLGD